MTFAARVGDVTAHPGMITGPGVLNVLIGEMPAAVVGDLHTCAFPPPAVHPPSPIIIGSTSVLIGGKSAARQGDTAGCGAVISVGCPNVLIGE